MSLNSLAAIGCPKLSGLILCYFQVANVQITYMIQTKGFFWHPDTPSRALAKLKLMSFV